ncbi:MAG: urea ABC transporter substrate-binding protein [Deltaproteobacteria bacterium]|nr:urea ABC transporter substrate-binding protein [Deltaproteobacteria bacterium]MCL6119957.1 urea ABC transporter substrate-binding protein [Deltaproteobacteria bacterium]
MPAKKNLKYVISIGVVILAVIIFWAVSRKHSSVKTAGKKPIYVGVLHSLTGTMAMSEIPVKNATLLAIDQINAKGGLLGRKIVPVIEDGASEPSTFAQKAKDLILKHHVSAIFGCWTSASRKAVLPVVQEYDNLLFYPVQYEGLEDSKNIIYLGSTPNQQIMPAVSWLLKKGYKKFYLIGSNYVFPRVANMIIKEQLKAEGGTVVGEQYTPLGSTDFSTIITKIKSAKPDVIFNTLNGSSNVAFFKQLMSAGITPKDIPVMSVSIAEVEVQGIGPKYLVGDYAAWNYFMSMKSKRNAAFIKDYQAKFGKNAVVDNPMEAGYFGVYLWAAAVKKAGSTNINKVRQAIRGISFKAPQGLVKVDPINNQTWQKVLIGQVEPNGQFKIVWKSSKSVRPKPFPSLISDEKVIAPGVIVKRKNWKRCYEGNCLK